MYSLQREKGHHPGGVPVKKVLYWVSVSKNVFQISFYIKRSHFVLLAMSLYKQLICTNHVFLSESDRTKITVVILLRYFTTTNLIKHCVNRGTFLSLNKLFVLKRIYCISHLTLISTLNCFRRKHAKLHMRMRVTRISHHELASDI